MVIEFKKHINYEPEFAEDLVEILVTVKEEDIVAETAGILEFVSPSAADPEEKLLDFSFSGHEELKWL